MILILIAVLFAAFSPSALGCGGEVTLNSNRRTLTIRSPGYPNGQKFAKCIWNIKAPTAQKMRISCPVIDLYTKKRCIKSPLIFSTSGQSVTICKKRASVVRSFATTKLQVDYKYLPRRRRTRGSRGFKCTVSFTPSNPENCHCGLENSASPQRIVGGENALKNQFPGIVLITINIFGSEGFCGGSLISSEWVMTAAHCVQGRQVNEIKVKLGVHNREGDRPRPLIRIPLKIIIHPNYLQSFAVNDIALLQIPHVDETREISPICLPFNSKAIAGKARTAGWGLTQEGGAQSSILQVVELDLHDAVECREINDEINSNYMPDTTICASAPGKDSCQGDSGGPLFVKEGNNNFQVGIVSSGIGCARPSTAGIYTKVESFTNWIKSETGESFCII